MTARSIVELIAMILVTGGVTAGLFQAIKTYLPDKNNLRRICAWVLSIVIALATSYLAGDVWGIIGSWGDGTLSAATLFAYGTGIWGASEALYRLWFKAAAATTWRN